MPKGEHQYKHGLSSKPWTQLYRCWVQMRNRCNNPNKPDYPYYGGRGIRVCRRWNDYTAFAADMGEPPTSQHTIERRNTDGNYQPSNCYWATRLIQARNRSYCRIKDPSKVRKLYATGNYTQAQLGAMFGVTQSQISYVVRS